MSKGNKNDAGKPDLSLIPKDAIWGMGHALTFGAGKYGRYNFRKGIEFSRLIAACLRHVTAFNEGEDLDPESGHSHVDHALASLAMLKGMMGEHPEMDDRYKPEITAEEFKKAGEFAKAYNTMKETGNKEDLAEVLYKVIQKVENASK